LVDDFVYEFLTTDHYFKLIDFVNNLRIHSSGCSFFQKSWKKPDGSFKIETIYLHKFIAEKWLSDHRSGVLNLSGFKNQNRLDCRVENLTWRSRAISSRLRKTNSSTGYTGVYKESNKYRAVISINKKSVHIGMFDTPEEAALAYNKVSKELYGDFGKINVIKSSI